MNPPVDDKEPIVEQPPSEGHAEDLTRRALGQRIRQQELLAELGVFALQGTTFVGMLDHTARMGSRQDEQGRNGS